MNSIRVKRLVNMVGLGLSLMATSAFAGFSVSGTQLLDANGQPFVMRGINHAHTWFVDQTASALPNIAATGANTVRVVLSNGQTWNKNSAGEISSITEQCKANKLICMFEVHDVTGVGDIDGNSSNNGTISGAADYWVEMAPALQGQEDYVLINIANEPVGNGVPASEWVGLHQDAIRKIRDAGLTHTLVVDAANWGQDWEEIMLNNASEVASADTLSNTMFSVHMYQVYQSYEKINAYVTRFLSEHNLPLIVGEFGDAHQGEAVDADAILAIAEQQAVGYLGWSWSGNDTSCCANLDITINFDPNNLSSWGERLINSENGIKATSKLATVYTDFNPPQSSSAAESSSSSLSSTSSSSTSSSVSSVASSAASSADDGENSGGGSIGPQMLVLLFSLLLGSKFLRRG